MVGVSSTAPGPLGRHGLDLDIDRRGARGGDGVDGGADFLDALRLGIGITDADAADELPLGKTLGRGLPLRAADVFIDLVADLVAHAGVVLAGSLEGEILLHRPPIVARPGRGSMRFNH